MFSKGELKIKSLPNIESDLSQSLFLKIRLLAPPKPPQPP